MSLDLKLSEHKFLEIESGIFPDECGAWFDFSIRWSRKCDHAGFRFFVEIFGAYFHFEIYDHRHWNIDEDRWARDDDPEPNDFLEEDDEVNF